MRWGWQCANCITLILRGISSARGTSWLALESATRKPAHPRQPATERLCGSLHVQREGSLEEEELESKLALFWRESQDALRKAHW